MWKRISVFAQNKMSSTFKCKFPSHQSKIGPSQIRWNAFNIHITLCTFHYSCMSECVCVCFVSRSSLSAHFSLHICAFVVDAGSESDALTLSLPFSLSLSPLAPLFGANSRILSRYKMRLTEMWFTKWSWAYIKSSECASDGMDVYTPLKAIFQLMPPSRCTERVCLLI